MKTIIFVLSFFCISIAVNAQTSTNVDAIKIGDVLMIGESTANSYQHIYFPKKNFIIKKGGIVDYKRIPKSKVVITAISDSPDGKVEVSFKLKNGKQFFNSHRIIKADLLKAIHSKELMLL
ncbi:hypothetical protein MWU65_08170 [Cellulophaga sp. F20128]|uniref:hypothetical protein n=1 Tax=Cellulophaga sp. F20128 TaxID=2926413 RepID=UPI001FF1C339|nr:hypothetical protein [Cellulophaga sp. F20128]MCK0157147.1 hypothetical protein [Cellulophaga sp. F20128]